MQASVGIVSTDACPQCGQVSWQVVSGKRIGSTGLLVVATYHCHFRYFQNGAWEKFEEKSMRAMAAGSKIAGWQARVLLVPPNAAWLSGVHRPCSGRLARLGLGDRFAQVTFGRRADGEEAAGSFALEHIRVTHRTVEIRRVTGREQERCIEFRMDFDFPLEHVDELLAGVSHQLAELLDGPGAQLADDGDELLSRDIRAQVKVIVIGRRYELAVALAVDAAPPADGGRRRRPTHRRKELCDVDAEPLAQANELVIGEREPVVLDLRQRRHRKPGAAAHLGKRPVFLSPQRAQRRTQACSMYGVVHNLVLVRTIRASS